jgi:hypothetical protein
MCIENVQRFADICSRDACCWRAKSWDISDVEGGKFFNLVSGCTETSTKITVNILQRKWRKSLFWKRRFSEKTTKKMKNSFCRGMYDAKLLLCALHEQDMILFHSFIHQWLYSPLLGPGLFFSSVIFCTQTVGLLGRMISPSQGRYLHTGQHEHTDIHALSGFETTIPAFKRRKTVHALDLATTVIGDMLILCK